MQKKGARKQRTSVKFVQVLRRCEDLGTQTGPMQFWVRKVLHGIGFHSRSIHFRYSPQIEDFPKHVLFIWDIHSKDVSNFAQFHWSTDGATATKKSAFFCRDQPLCQFHSLAASGHSHWAYVALWKKTTPLIEEGNNLLKWIMSFYTQYLSACIVYIYICILICVICVSWCVFQSSNGRNLLRNQIVVSHLMESWMMISWW